MGHGASKPGPPTIKMEVLGLGMSRTGTSSFARALEILLGGPVYHGGAYIVGGSNAHMRRWVEVLRVSYRHRRDPDSVTVADRAYQKFLVAKQLQGFAAVTDTPSNMFPEILMELFPDAKVIITTRDPEKWWQSFLPLVQRGSSTLSTSPLLFWVPGLRYWGEWHKLLSDGRWRELYYLDGRPDPGPQVYSRHIEYMERVVPKDKLYYYDVKSGWGPLCEILELPVPDVEFPKENDATTMKSVFNRILIMAVGLWAAVLTAIVAAVVGGLYARQHAMTVPTIVDSVLFPLFSTRA